MSESKTIIVERSGPVTTVALIRPEVLNTFDAGLRRALRDTLEQLATDRSTRAVVLTGEGRLFSSGADLKAGAPTAAETRAQLADEYGPALRAIAQMPKPVVAALDGPAVGIGLAFALVCDLRVMAQSAYLQAPFNAIGLLPDGGLSWLLPRALGLGRAFEFVVDRRKLAASDCLELGIANRVVADGRARREAQSWAQSLAQQPAQAVAATKQALREALSSSYTRAVELESELQARLVESDDCREGIAAFREKRAPKFRSS